MSANVRVVRKRGEGEENRGSEGRGKESCLKCSTIVLVVWHFWHVCAFSIQKLKWLTGVGGGDEAAVATSPFWAGGTVEISFSFGGWLGVGSARRGGASSSSSVFTNDKKNSCAS